MLYIKDDMEGFFLKLITQGFVLLLAYFAPIKGLVHAVFFLWLLDWIFGVWRSLIARRKITSYRFRKSVTKIVNYLAAIVATWVIEKTFLDTWLPLTKFIAGYIGFTELTSIYENISDITGKKFVLNFINFIKTQFKDIKYVDRRTSKKN